MTILVTGATGALGGRVVEALRQRGVRPEDILALGRRTDVLAGLAAQGVRTAATDLRDTSTLTEWCRDVDAALLVSVPGAPDRLEIQTGAVRALGNAGVEHLVYTSWVHADTTTMALARDHLGTEAVLRSTAPDSVVLRCSGYFEARFGLIPLWRRLGKVIGATDGAPISSATRDDLAAAAAAVLVDRGHAGQTYELASDLPYRLEDLAALLRASDPGGLPVVDLDAASFEDLLVDEGFERRLARNLAEHDQAIADGQLLVRTGALRGLLGQAPVELPEALAAWSALAPI